ncbi:hypothetical protein ACSMFR_03880 [Listeria aquatica]|uniref:hypothetical protein n=1 Tax=Listeria aquatica TaxID=1494960 RepID=UPI003F6F7AA3
MIETINSETLIQQYSQIGSQYNCKEELPRQVFKYAKYYMVIDIEAFLYNDLKDIISFSKYERSTELIWLPHINKEKANSIIKMNLLKEIKSNISYSLIDFFEEKDLLFSLLEYGCLFNDKKNWIAQFSTELGFVVIGVFEKNCQLSSWLKSEPYTKEGFLREYQTFQDDYVNISEKETHKYILANNNNIIYPMIKNYFD